MKQCDCIFQLQRLSVNDGEGIRTTVFFKGCGLRCKWCANPESWHSEPQLMFLAHKCTGCRKCASVCPSGANHLGEDGRILFQSEICKMCGQCLRICPANARQAAGRYLSAAEIMRQIEQDIVFYEQSGGGVTFSGGEPFLHAECLRKLIRLCGRIGISTAAESCGLFDLEKCRDILEAMDMLFFDIKMMDSRLHKKYTGAGNEKILRNIAGAAQLNDRIVIRVPVIKGINDGGENFLAMSAFMKKNGLAKVELLPYHALGREKMQALGMEAEKYAAPADDEMMRIEDLLVADGMTIVSYK